MGSLNPFFTHSDRLTRDSQGMVRLDARDLHLALLSRVARSFVTEPYGRSGDPIPNKSAQNSTACTVLLHGGKREKNSQMNFHPFLL